MTSLAEVVGKRRQSGQSRTRSLVGSLSDKFKEKIDPRQFFNQSGVMTALFPKLKAYKASGTIDSKLDTKISLNKLQKNDETGTNRVIKNTKIAAKNFLLLPSISRDINVMRQNLVKLSKQITGSASTKADMYFIKQKETEKLYESQFEKNKENTKSPYKIESAEKEKKSFSWLNFIGMVGAGVASTLFVDFLMNRENSIVSKLYDSIEEKIINLKKDLKTYVFSLYDDIEKGIDNQLDLIGNNLDELMDELSDVSLVRLIKDALQGVSSITDQFDEKLEAAKKRISEGLQSFSVLPAAQAATLPTLPSPTTTRAPSVGLPPPSEPSAGGFTSPTQRSETQELLDRIAKAEGTDEETAKSRGLKSSYDVTYNYGRDVMPEKPLSEMTLAEVKQFQQKQIEATRGKIPGRPKNEGTGAVGRYQITSGTLDDLKKQMGLKDTDIFSKELQDKMAIQLLKNRGLEKYLSGEITPTEFQNRISRTWASIPTTSGSTPGSSFYGQPVRPDFVVPTPNAQAAVPPSTTPTNARISSGFGTRRHPVTGEMHHHSGIDVAVPTGTPIRSVKPGKVIFAGEQRGYGYSVEVKHEDDTSTFYAHLSKIGVKVDQSVKAGETVGLSGGGANDPGRGTSTGPHLHFELRVNGRKVDPGRTLALSSLSSPTLASREPRRDSSVIDVMSTLVQSGQEPIRNAPPRTIVVAQNNTQVLTRNRTTGQAAPDYTNGLVDRVTQ